MKLGDLIMKLFYKGEFSPNKNKPFYKKWWGILIIAILLAFLGIILLGAFNMNSMQDDFSLKKDGEIAKLRYKIPTQGESSKVGVFGQKGSGENKLYIKKKNNEAVAEFQIAFINYGNDVSVKTLAQLLNVSKKDISKDLKKDDIEHADESLSVINIADSNAEKWKAKSVLFYKDNATFYINISSKESAFVEDIVQEIINSVDIKNFRSDLLPEELLAIYMGETRENTLINEKSPISVDARLDNGSVVELKNWKIKNPQKLKAGKSTTIVVEYHGIKTSLKIKCSTLSKAQYKARCKKYDYNTLAHHSTDNLLNKKIKVVGKIMQVLSYGNYLVKVNDGFDIIHLTTDGTEGKKIENDSIVAYGKITGDFEYKTALGVMKTVPEIYGKYVE